ncbi:MAG: glycosyltransferase [Anaerolineales bacterium]|nr:glycosyltransferase [Anaerolineales bacterium]
MNNTNYPKISVITPSYNQGEFIEATIQSVLDQKYPNLEYIIMDGGSTDESVKIIKKYEKYFAYWVSEKDKGQTNAINKGFQRATGDILAWLNSDDFYYPNSFDYIVQAYHQYPDAGLYIGNGNITDRNGKVIRRYSNYVGFDVDTLINGQSYILQPSVFINRIAFDKVGLLNETLHFEMDIDYWIRIGKEFDVVVMDEILSAYRWYEDIKTNAGAFKRWMEMYRVRSQYTNKTITPGLLTEFFLTLEKDFVSQDLGINFADTAKNLHSLVYSQSQKALNLKDNIPVGRGIYFIPQKSQTALQQKPKRAAPAVVSTLGSKPKVDVVIQATGTHAWAVGGGWANGARKLGIFHRMFSPKSKWGDVDVEDDDGLYAYLANPQADLILLLGFDWHSQMLHQTERWRERWAKAKISKILYVQESVINNCTLFQNSLMKEAVISAANFSDAIVYTDITDKDWFTQLGLPAMWQPFGVDDVVFYNRKPFKERIPRPFFRGKTTPYFTNKTYETRRELIQFLSENNAIELLEYKDKPVTSEEIAEDFCNYQIALNFPSLFSNHPSRVYEALGCGCALLTNYTGEPTVDNLFEHNQHLVYYSDKNSLLDAIRWLQSDPVSAEQIASQGMEYVFDNFTLDKQLNEIITWLESAKTIKEKPEESTAIQLLPPSKGKVLIDGVIFQLQKDRPVGISRVWKSLLTELAKSDMADNIILLDRASTAPIIPGIRRKPIDGFDYRNMEDDPIYLQSICDQENAALFISTYYTYPENTHLMLLLHDMIPETKGMDLTEAQWVAKAKAIDKASSFLSVSESTESDFRKVYPQKKEHDVYITYNAVSDTFRPHNEEEIHKFKKKYDIRRPYFLIVGNRTLYKNTILFFRAFSLLENKEQYEIVCTGGPPELEKIFLPYVKGSQSKVLYLSDEDLTTAYSGAVALVYPSQHEGFGLPVLEAMKSGCPVITCRNSSLPEVAKSAAIYVDENDVAQMKEALLEIQKPEKRQQLVAAGYKNALRFSWEKTGQKVENSIKETLVNHQNTPLNPDEPVHTGSRFIHALIQRSYPKESIEGLEYIKRLYTGLTRFNFSELVRNEKLVSDMDATAFNLLEEAIEGAEYCDAFLYYWYGLTLQKKGRAINALSAYITAIKHHNWPAGYRWRVADLASQVAELLGDTVLAINLLENLVLQEYPTYVTAQNRLRRMLGSKKSGAQKEKKPEFDFSKQELLSTQENVENFNIDTDHPLVSAIVSTYNSANFLRGCLEDLEAQTIVKQTEIIVVDSGSQQNEPAIMESFQRRYPNIHYLRTEQRESVYAAWNRAIKMAKGKYITNANTDDRHAPDAFEIMVNALEENPETGVVYGDCAITQKTNTTLAQGPITGRFRWPDFDRRLLFQVCFIGPQPMWRRSLHDEFGLFDDKMTSAGDYEFWLRISDKTQFHHIPQVLGLYLMAEQSLEHRRATLSVDEAQEARSRYWDNENENLPPTLGSVFLESYRAVSTAAEKYPLVSVVVPTFNRPNELVRALESIASQTYPEIEAVVINDGGKDVSSVVNRFDKKLSVQYINQKENRGAGAARNLGMQSAKGRFIAFLDDDDEYHQEHLFMLVSELVANKSIAAAYSDALQITVGQRGNKTKVVSKEVYYSNHYSPDLLLVRNYIPNLCLVFRREALDEAGLFDEQMSALEDWEWLIRLSRVGSFSHIPAVSAEYVVRQGVKSRNILPSSDIASLYQHIYTKHASFASPKVRKAQREYFRAMTGQKIDFAEAEASEDVQPSNGRAIETLQLLLNSDDLTEALEQHKDRLDNELLKLVLENAETAREDGDLELAEGLSDLADYIDSLVNQG